MINVPDSEFELQADLVVLAMGFEHLVHEGLADAFGIDYTARGNAAVDKQFMTNVEGVFAAGDAKRGASLVVWAIQEGREVAKAIDSWLMAPALANDLKQQKATA